ncbi:MAG: type III PLP-dependent enzyme [Vicinamibacterales bacterium]
MDTQVVAARYAALARALPGVELCYAVKANPLPGVLDTLASLDASFDIASDAELRLCLDQGMAPSRLSFGSPVKSAVAIARAYEAGVRRFTVDARAELDKVAVHAPGASVLVRLATSGRGAEWPLSRKFGCDPVTALDLLRRARALGLHPDGLTFHVGSQQTDPSQWDAPIAACATIFSTLHREGIHLPCLNVGGGFPAPYGTPVPAIEAVGEAILESVRRHFGQAAPRLMAEPGRYLVAEAGVIEAQVVLVADRASGEPRRWVYIDCGKFGGLAETADEAIRYPLHVPGRHGDPVRVALAGPTCDSADILYERTPCLLPGDIREGDRLRILCAGAYTYTYASVGFNGFPPLTAVAI